MPKTMLIDATHPEETRVAVVDGNKLVEFDYESIVRKQLKGGIFLAKVTRVEPSLQAAFVNFGGNRHGFLPFSEIHPDYFRIPVADREALLAAQMAELEEHDEEMEREEADMEARQSSGSVAVNADDAEEDEDEDLEAVVEVGGEDQPLLEEDEEGESEVQTDAEESRAPIAMSAPVEILQGPIVEEDHDHDDEREQDEESFAAESSDNASDEQAEEADHTDEDGDEEDYDAEGDDDAEEGASESVTLDAEGNAIEGEAQGDNQKGRRGRGGRNRGRHRGGRSRQRNASNDDQSVDMLGGDSVEGDRPFRFNMRKSYKIQEVIKRGQIMLIQVSKEERGNKGAAVTTYLSLPGRYCVLMPNSPRGGGVSRKIASFKDRKRMKDMLGDLSVPDGMSVILRTAGVSRTKVEVKRDLDYLTRLWNTIREHTLQSSAPALIYEEGSLIKRAIRDLYTRDIEDVYVCGEEGYKAAKDFMKMLMPSHAKKVQEYKNAKIPLFHKFGVENQINDTGEPTVTLKSGGYLVINPTEALVSIDVNSGRATKERHIEETALKTNLEAADELARQLRLRDLGGLVVVDFIDMEDRRNNRKVEQRLRDALSTDRARIQVGRISSFGLLELSRQRLNPSLAEAQTEICQHCAGIGRVRTLDFSAISIMRALEAEGIRGKAGEVTLTMSSAVAVYILNNKRRILTDIEARYGFTVKIVIDDAMSQSHFTLEAAARSAEAPKISRAISSVSMPEGDYEEDDMNASDDEGSESSNGSKTSDSETRSDEEGDEGEGARRRRRGRRGGRGRRGNRDKDDTSSENGEEAAANDQGSVSDDVVAIADNVAPTTAEEGSEEDRGNRRPRGGRTRGRRDNRERRPRRENGADAEAQTDNAPSSSPAPEFVAPVSPAAPAQNEGFAIRASNDRPAEPVQRDYETVNQAPETKKKGWWNRLVE
jgi:ribonuclease E